MFVLFSLFKLNVERKSSSKIKISSKKIWESREKIYLNPKQYYEVTWWITFLNHNFCSESCINFFITQSCYQLIGTIIKKIIILYHRFYAHDNLALLTSIRGNNNNNWQRVAIDTVINSFRSPLYDPMYAIKQHFIHFYSIYDIDAAPSHCTLSISPTEFVVPRRMAQFTTVFYKTSELCNKKSPQRPFLPPKHIIIACVWYQPSKRDRNTLHCPSLTLLIFFYDDDDERDLSAWFMSARCTQWANFLFLLKL